MPSVSSLLSSIRIASALGTGSPFDLGDYSAIFQNTGIVPDYVPSFFGQPLGLVLANSTAPFDVGHGYTIPGMFLNALIIHRCLTDGKEATSLPAFSLDPTVAAPFAQAGATFVIISIDHDSHSPQNTSAADTRHYIGPNYTVDAAGALTNSTSAISEWFGSAPSNGTFPHR
jgi:hypothetical protein